MKSFQLFLFLTVIFLRTTVSFAQMPMNMPVTGTIKGNISDAESKKPLEFAAVALYNLSDSLITGVITDLDGDFSISKINPGAYYVKIDFVGYITKRIDSINISAEAPFKNLGKISLITDAKMQAEVVVKAEKSLMQLGLDKRVFNVEKSALSDAENATEVLRGTPGVEVDKDEAVKVRGKSVTVFINGKPTGLSGDNQAAILRQIPANTIRSIEIMTNPSAKNAPDGGGSSIINIVLKKNNLQGFTGSLNGGIGTNALAFRKVDPQGPWFNKYNGGLALNYKSRKINVFSNINLNDRNSFSFSESYRYNILPDSAYYFNTYNDNFNNNQSIWGRLGTDIYINETNTLSLQMNANPSRGGSTGDIRYDNFDADSIMSGFDKRTNTNNNNSNGINYNAIYSIIFPEKDSTGAPNLDKLGMMGENRELVFDVQYNDSRTNNRIDFLNNHYRANGDLINVFQDNQKTRTNLTNSTLTAKVDYTHPMTRKEMKLQTGYQFTWKKDRNDFLYQYYDTINTVVANDTGRSNIFDYTQQIQAVYGTFSHKWNKKWSAEYGLRVEYAYVRPYLENTQTAYPWDYFGFFPTVNVAYEISETQQMNFEFGRRVSRPWIWDVNPFPDYDDPRFLSSGNPYLRPTYTNNIGANYALYAGKQSITMGVYGNLSTGETQWITNISPNNGILNSSPQNLGMSSTLGFDLNGNFNLAKWWSINSSVSGYYMKYNADKIDSKLSYSSLGGNASMYLNMRFKFGLSFNIGFHTWYAAREIQGRTIPNMWHWTSLTQDFLKKKLKLTLSLNNPFFVNIWKTYTNTPFTSGYSESKWENRVLNLRLSYNFGKTTVKKPRASRLENRSGGDTGGAGNQGGRNR